MALEVGGFAFLSPQQLKKITFVIVSSNYSMLVELVSDRVKAVGVG